MMVPFQVIVLQPLIEAANLFIHEGNFTVIEADRRRVSISRKIGLWRFIRQMGIIKVNPGKERLTLISVSQVRAESTTSSPRR